MRVAVVTGVSQAVLADVFVQRVEGVQRADDRRAAPASVRPRGPLLGRAPRQRGGHRPVKTLVAVASRLRSRPTIRQEQGSTFVNLSGF